MTEPLHCSWCSNEITSAPVTDEFLTDLFGYVYCSEECKEAHIDSK